MKAYLRTPFSLVSWFCLGAPHPSNREDLLTLTEYLAIIEVGEAGRSSYCASRVKDVVCFTDLRISWTVAGYRTRSKGHETKSTQELRESYQEKTELCANQMQKIAAVCRISLAQHDKRQKATSSYRLDIGGTSYRERLCAPGRIEEYTSNTRRREYTVEQIHVLELGQQEVERMRDKDRARCCASATRPAEARMRREWGAASHDKNMPPHARAEEELGRVEESRARDSRAAQESAAQAVQKTRERRRLTDSKRAVDARCFLAGSLHERGQIEGCAGATTAPGFDNCWSQCAGRWLFDERDLLERVSENVRLTRTDTHLHRSARKGPPKLLQIRRFATAPLPPARAVLAFVVGVRGRQSNFFRSGDLENARLALAIESSARLPHHRIARVSLRMTSRLCGSSCRQANALKKYERFKDSAHGSLLVLSSGNRKNDTVDHGPERHHTPSKSEVSLPRAQGGDDDDDWGDSWLHRIAKATVPRPSFFEPHALRVLYFDVFGPLIL
ncbi:hypothetical protein C8R47DRAFT_1084700 [Mycena vitilis]|nr:hypothetical protein C8R47DRAFT_1084700 [Mycena vitilis]